MKIEQRTVYIADNGTEFDTEGECLEYEKSVEFKDYLAYQLYENTELREYNSNNVVEFIVEHFSDILEKYNSL